MPTLDDHLADSRNSCPRRSDSLSSARLVVKQRLKLIVNCGYMFLLAMVSCLMLPAQSGATAALSGTIADPSGAVVPGASITLTFAQTSAERKTITGAEGGFLFLQLNTGEYRMTVDAAGFRSI